DPNGQRGFASHDWQIGIVTYAEAKFIEAEAKARLGQTGVQAALQQAVTASVTKITGVAPSGTFLANATTTFDIANIIQQKYIALFLTMEPYNDYRRTGFPALIPNQNSDTKTIAVRLPTPSDERQYNRNATVVSNVTTKLWWDAN
ncbi:MAG TPA: SusD/RagB family nutrient-binding outer membrane lipoprotein, partial [Flavobacterium sp.]|uniref:SusD/RagB family nutrient-binding outer membrane lipoprotein n=1 Tax=Flavobacterium sp. TaxID=239 RepID=UPI002ED211DA